MNPHLARADVLLNQSRYDLAQKEILQALSDQPDSPIAHAMLSICLHALKQYAKAVDHARQAITYDPEMPMGYFALALGLSGERKYKEAEEAVRTAIDRESYDAQFWALLGEIQFNQKKWKEALESVDTGLSFDAENTACRNIRTFTLSKLGRNEEAIRTAEGVLADDPENAESHVSAGWAALHQSDTQKALHHFREALRIDPELEGAREGMLLALKAQHRLYRWMLQYSLWMSKKAAKHQFIFILAIFLLIRFGRQLADKSPGLSMVIWPLVIVAVLFTLSTWLADPIFNLLLLANRFGRHALSREQKWCAILVGLTVLIGLSLVALYFATNDSMNLALAASFGMVGVGITSVFQFSLRWPRLIASGVLLVAIVLNQISYQIALVVVAMDKSIEANREVLKKELEPIADDAPLPRELSVKLALLKQRVDRANGLMDSALNLLYAFQVCMVGLLLASQSRTFTRR
jgi:tetratricopeptide (TPR) repeat protein